MRVRNLYSLRSTIAQYLCTMVLMVLALGKPLVATADVVSVPFNEGFVGTVGSNTQKAANITVTTIFPMKRVTVGFSRSRQLR